jgi:hypothetical protein
VDAEKPRITYEATPIVWIEVKGEPATEEEQRKHSLPLVPRDGGIVLRLHAFMEEHGIYRAVRPGHSGGGGFSGGFYEDHAEKIIRFLNREGCKTTTQK